ncbi:putative photosynthetic complex assembly protein PuhE [Beijerinckia sp. L45]|uniref:putative photosynthetic complex assembly protein PuhE n=1 Tax=Beijerinckia sp. L45 TaxID=1641855 RepID=UPI00131DB905|nr:putative photosynthetic complex assembly protein PuhE [Beijerinckia sp. L45]
MAPPILYALFVWWFSTGIVLLLVLRRRRTIVWSLVGAAVLFPVSLYWLARSGADDSVTGAYVAFTAAILLWGTQELAFLTGFLTGPRPLPCPPASHGLRRVAYAIGAILYHELALIGSGAAVAAVTFGTVNQVGFFTFLILWVMRLSAKLNLFLGVPVLNDAVMPDHLTFLRSYFVRGAVNRLFPLAMIVSILATVMLIQRAFAAEASAATLAGSLLLAALLALAILEHGFMMVRLPVDALWRWSTLGGVQSAPAAGNGSTDIHRRDPPRELGDVERVLPTVP